MLIPKPPRDEWLELAGADVVVPLTQGAVAVISAADAAGILQRKWFAARNGKVFYAHRCAYDAGRNITVRMHRVIINAQRGEFVDHANGDGLDNRRSNLRICSLSQNSRNAGKWSGGSGFKGVSLSNTGNRWVANIWFDSHLHFLGSFTSETDAARAYDAAADRNFGAFARLNFPREAAE